MCPKKHKRKGAWGVRGDNLLVRRNIRESFVYRMVLKGCMGLGMWRGWEAWSKQRESEIRESGGRAGNLVLCRDSLRGVELKAEE